MSNCDTYCNDCNKFCAGFFASECEHCGSRNVETDCDETYDDPDYDDDGNAVREEDYE